MNELIQKLHKYLEEPTNPRLNLDLAIHYEHEGQLASAFSFYLRVAEIEENTHLAYECLIKLANILRRIQTRDYVAEGLLLRAISLKPSRAEAYYHISDYYEKKQKMWEAYTYASIGTELTIQTHSELNLDYQGQHALHFQKAVAAWWIGLFEESINILYKLNKDKNLPQPYKDLVRYNLEQLEFNKIPFEHYTPEKKNQLKYPFEGSENIRRNFSEVYQDIFILTLLKGKRNGTYLEIGSAGPYYGNNTAILEENYEWKGISIDYDQEQVKKFSQRRNNPVICKDATTINYEELLKRYGYEKNIDYLQLDCEPAETTYEILTKIPFEKYKFRIITFEHDYYLDKENKKEEETIKHKSRKLLKEQGYEPIILNVCTKNGNSFEDWWIHPELVDKELTQKLKTLNEEPTHPKKILFN